MKSNTSLSALLSGKKGVLLPPSEIPSSKCLKSHTFVLDQVVLDKIKAFAWWGRKSQKEILTEALNEYFERRGEEVVEAVKEYSKNRCQG